MVMGKKLGWLQPADGGGGDRPTAEGTMVDRWCRGGVVGARRSLILY